MNEYNYKDFPYMSDHDKGILDDGPFIYHTFNIDTHKDVSLELIRINDLFVDCKGCPLQRYKCNGIHCDVVLNK